MLFITGAKSPDKSFPSVMKANTFRIESCVYDTKERHKKRFRSKAFFQLHISLYYALVILIREEGHLRTFFIASILAFLPARVSSEPPTFVHTLLTSPSTHYKTHSISLSFFFLSLSLFFHRIYHLFTTHDASQRLP